MIARALIALMSMSALSACTTVKDYATCDNARAVVVLAQRAVERVCPINP